jgi:squalene-associated FAD-dependent desaturase
MSSGTTHIVGAGLAGLSAAIELSRHGHKVIVYELARHAGGRCRSYFEPALGLTIDNGNHLVLSGNACAAHYLDVIGGRSALTVADHAEFAFHDAASGERWVLRPNDGQLPWWIFSRLRRVPGTRAFDYLGLGKLLFADDRATVTQVVGNTNNVYRKLLYPVLLAALNCDPAEGSARLASGVIRGSLARGGKACRPLLAPNGLGPALVDPAVAFIRQNGGDVRFDSAVRAIDYADDCVRSLQFAEGALTLAPEDQVILAVPGWVARTLVPEVTVPTDYRAIFNLHFKVKPPADMAKIIGVINGTTEWLFAFDDRLSVTVSAADRFNETEREPLARQIWAEVAKIAGLTGALPPWQIVKERRATFAATPQQDALRPAAETRWTNLYLAGDWTATALPATIEGAIGSGAKAAKLAMAKRFC